MNRLIIAAMTTLTMTAPVYAEGDAAAGEKAYRQCKSCHTIVGDDGTVHMKGGKTGPNLYGVIGRTAGSVDGFKYGKDLVAAGEAGLVWDVDNIVDFTADPKAFLKTYLDKGSAKSKMTYKLRKGGEDMAAFLATFSPAPAEAEEATTEEAAADG